MPALQQILSRLYYILLLLVHWLNCRIQPKVSFFFLERDNLRVYQRALKEGGVIFFETLLGMDEDKLTPEYYLQRGELLRTFTRFEIIHWDEGVPCGDKKFSEQLVARKQLEGRR